jgi:cytochrome c oxidase subunit 4
MEPPTAIAARERPHPGPREYVKIAVALSIVTLLEVAVYYVDFLRPALVPLLLIFAVIKFVLVILWFMHLRFDSRLFMRVFLAGVILAIAIFVAAFGLFFGADA